MHRFHGIICAGMVLAALIVGGMAKAADLPAIGEWDGVTPSAKLEGPYEDPTQANVPFGIISYFNMPWRAYMDTWPADHFTHFCATQWNVNQKYAEALCQVFEECGIRAIRYEIGWGNMGWDDELAPHVKTNMKRDLAIFQQHGIRPLILLNAHHGVPCPVRDVPVEVTADAKKGDTILKLKNWDKVRPGYTGIQHPHYIANSPTITRIDEDGTAHLSAGLPDDIKAGPFRLVEVKYKPFQGVKLKDGTPVPEAQETFDGWMKYVVSVAKTAREALGTEGKADAGFDIEVWNEQTFGSNFLDINRYYDAAQKLEFAEPYTYRHTREMQPGFRPDAKLQFEQKGAYAILPMTIDYFNDPKNNYPGVHVISGFANQWPWDNGTELWDGQDGFSRHFYTGGYMDCTPEKPLYKVNSGTIDAQGNFDGKKDGKDWHSIEPLSNFVPTFRMAMPEFYHTGFKTEMITRDVMPDSRLAYFRGHGRYTHNGDFRTAEVWQTEVNYDRSPFFNDLFNATGAKRDDPRALALDQHMAGKTMLRQYLFHCAKGLYRIFIFSPQPDAYSIGMLPKSFYEALDKNNLTLNDEVRKTLPPEFLGLKWLMTLMDSGEKIAAPRPLQVKELVEYKPRLVFAGKGTPAHPHRWNRDNFVFMPFQLSASKYVIPYYVMTLDVTHVWNKAKDPFDPARYDMPEQDFDVTIGNVAGTGATVSGYDLLTNTAVPMTVVASTQNTLTVRVKAVDYPRVLVVTEKQAGPQILDPMVTADKDGVLKVSWRTNIPVKAEVTYGRDWQNRSANLVAVNPTEKNNYATTIPTGMTGVVAVRIKVTANGLSDVWPRWDEDPQGQVAIPAPAAQPNQPVNNPPAVNPAAQPGAQVAKLTVPAGVVLPVAEVNQARGYAVSLPKGMTLEGTADDREGVFGAAGKTVTVRVRYLTGAGKSAEDYLPATSVGDEQETSTAALADGTVVTLVNFDLQATAHPGMTNLCQRFLYATAGAKDADLLLVAISGSAEAMKAQEKVINGMLASVTIIPAAK